MNILSYGMCTSLGVNAKQSCAAFRAGLTRSSPVDFFEVGDAQNETTEQLLCSQAPLVTQGFNYSVRQKILLAHALEDIWPNVERYLPGCTNVPCFLILANDERIDFAPPDDDNYDQFETLEPTPPSARDLQTAQELLASAAFIASIGCGLTLIGLSKCGYTGTAEALRAVQEYFVENNQPVLLLATDSLVYSDAISWLEQWGRLRSPENPVGLQPGEAGACLLIAPATYSDSKVKIDSTFIAREDHHQLSGENAIGKACANIIGQASDSYPGKKLNWIVSDQNGEYYRGMEWGNVLLQLKKMGAQNEFDWHWQIGESFGDVGAVSGLLAIGNVSRAIERGYAPADAAVILCADELHDRTGILVMRSGA